MSPAESCVYLVYVTPSQPEFYSDSELGEFANPILERASAMKDSLNLQTTAISLERKSTKSPSYTLSVGDISWWFLRRIACRNRVQPICVDTGTKKKQFCWISEESCAESVSVLILS